MRVNGFIKGLPPCPPAAANVRTVQTVGALRQLANTFAFVVDNATTYFVDSSHQATIIATQPLFLDGYDADANPRKLRNQVVFDFRNNIAYVYNHRGDYRVIELKGGK